MTKRCVSLQFLSSNCSLRCFFCCSVSESQIISVLQSLEDVRFGLTDMFLMFPRGEVKRQEMQIVDRGYLRCYLGHEQCQQLFCAD